VVGSALVLVLLLAMGGTGWAIVDRIERPAEGAQGAGGVAPTPDGWDPRIQPLADVVAELRGRPFLRPVTVEFLEDAEFEAAVVGEGELTDEDRADLDDSTTLLRALGLIGSDVDLLEESEELVGGGTLAFYDSETELVTVRGTDLGVAARVTVVHELAHAWQDQHFDLDRIDEMDDVEAANLRTLAEGDATLVEDAYVARLSSAEQREYERTSSEAGEDAWAQLAEVPDVLMASFTSPYAIGPGFVGILEIENGNAAIDDALTDPPDTEIELLDPARWLEGGTPAADVAAPAATPRAEVLDESDFGALSWLFTLAQRIDPRVALETIDGWAGDQVTTYRDGDRSCAAIAVRATDGRATAAWVTALEQWMAAGPAGTASLERGTDLVLRSCEVPGATSPAGEASYVALQFAALRLSAFAGAYDQPTSTIAQASCFADEVAGAFTPEELASQEPLAPMEQERRGRLAAEACFN
jgi:hypothetical protein